MRLQIFWQVVPVQQLVQYGRDAAHISWAAWVLKSLEDYMNVRQQHLNESSSARLGRSQKLEILPRPNSKQTQSLGANFLMDAYILIGDFNVRLVSVVYYVPQWFYNSAQLCRQHLPPIFCCLCFAANICRLYLPHIFAAYICRLYFESPPIFWASANILCMCKYFKQTPIF